MACDFITELSKLRKLSIESVENTASFNAFKKYLHVRRPVENELRLLLDKVNAEGKKTLILLCGSAGDGKSHLISFLRNADDAGLLDTYELYNDATESSAPKLTSIDTLAEKLAPFNDVNFSIDDGFKMILAINLGTLNNFIESEKGRAFSVLKKYVEENDLFSTCTISGKYQENSVFQHVNFSDYQLFTLTPNGIGTEYLEALFGKVFHQSEENPFFNAYLKNDNCPLCQKCPVRHNFEFLSNPARQKVIINKIVEVVVKDKAIISTRDILNLLYDLLVHPDFDYNSMCELASTEIDYLKKYIQYTTPMLMYEFDDISPLVNAIRKHDSLKERLFDTDVDVIRFYTLEDINNSFMDATIETPYSKLSETTQVGILGGKKADLKKLAYRFIVRTMELKGNSPPSMQRKLFDEYIRYLYFQHSGNEKKLRKLYEAMQTAVMSWDGQFDSDSLCIDDSNEKFWVLEQLYMSSAPYQHNMIQTSEEIHRFSTSLKLRFKNKNTDNASLQTAEISIDFGLFEMISKMCEGYRPTIQDKNRHTDFVSFVQRLIEFGNKATRITLVPKDYGSNFKVIFEKTDFGYRFKRESV